MTEKDFLRKQILEKRAALTPAILAEAKKNAAKKLLSATEYEHAKTVMLYMDFRNEVPTGDIIEALIASDKNLVLPLTNSSFSIVPYLIPKGGILSDYLTISKFGIAEPNPKLCEEADLRDIDLVVVPGSVFDQNGNRMGYGKGCYDRFFSKFPKEVFKLALAYDFQVLPCIPTSPFDVKMDQIITISTV